jgi:hypothetical protein
MAEPGPALAETVYGSTLPRLWTPPLRELTPDTSYGFDLIDFARDVCGTPFDPWQEWLSVHVGELLPDGRPRFRKVLVLVARQNGKTTWAKALIHYWMHVEAQPLTLITSTDRSYAKRTWTQVHEAARENEWMKLDLGPDPLRLTPSEESFKTAAGAEVVFRANNRRAGRSMTLNRWLCDELREHHDRDAWGSATNAQNAVPDAQTVAITNQGDADSVVLDSLRDPALKFVETGDGDPRLGLFEWSAPDGAEPDDVAALLQANPNAGRPGHGPDLDVLIADAERAKHAGGMELSEHRTEVMCQRVHLIDPAIEPTLWDAAGRHPVLDLALHRDKVALCLDVSLSGDRADLIAAADIDGVIHLDVVRAWSGPYCTQELRRELPDVVAQVAPRAIGWFPNGPAAVVAADLLANRRGGSRWPPRRVKLVELTTEAPTAAMSFAGLVKVGEVHHTNDPALNAQIGNAQRLAIGQRWTFGRRGSGPVSGCYAAAGAAWLARTLPPPPPPLSSA